jgi:DNA repair protein RadC
VPQDSSEKDSSEKAGSDKPHYLGHRERLREKFIEQGPDALADYEIIELLLTLARPRIDCKPIAKALLQQFGSLPGVMAAHPDALRKVDDVGEGTIVALKLVQAVAQRMLKREVLDKPVLDSWNKVLDYCHSVMAHQREEQLRLFFLDGRNALVADEVQSKGTVNHTPLYVREVVKRALELGASALIMAHNHPTGDPSPSRDDIALTREVRLALKAVGVSLHDHIIIGRKGHSSLRSMNVIDGWK